MARLAILIPDMRGGGAERVALTLIEGFVERGHDVDLLLPQMQGELLDLIPAGVRIIDLKSSRMRQAIRPLSVYLRQFKPDGLIAMMWPMPVIALMARMLAGTQTRIVASEHNVLSEQYRQHRLRLAALRLTTRHFYPLADHRVAASAGIAVDLANISGISRSAIEVVANPIPMPPANSTVVPDEEQLWGAEGARILTVGSLKPEKNHRLLLNAFARVARVRDARLMILGEGALRQVTEEWAVEFGVSDRVAMPGFRADIWPFYSSADLFVLSSDSEGFGNVLVEAMAVGLPVVSTDCAGPREVLADGQYGTLVPCGDAEALADALVRALDSPADRDGLKARAWEHRPEVAVDRFIDMLTGHSLT